MDEVLISVITPVLNGSVYVEAAWHSLLDQDWKNWEWLVIDNGSDDDSLEKLQELSRSDERIRVFEESKPGAGAARNVGLEHAEGEWLCFLDIDDVLPRESLSARVQLLMQHPETEVADGKVEVMDAALASVLRTWTPDFRGDAFPELLRLNPQAFFGMTWMLSRERVGEHRFSTELSHCEDLLFFMSLGPVSYDFVDAPVLRYRTGTSSVMSDLRGLEEGYHKVSEWVSSQSGISHDQADSFRQKARGIVFRSWLKRGKPLAALRSLLRSW